MFESILCATHGLYTSSEFTRVAHELQFIRDQNGGLINSREAMESLEEYRGFRGMNKSLPYLELHTAVSFNWTKLWEGLHMPIKLTAAPRLTKPRAYISGAQLWLVCSDASAHLLRYHKIQTVKVQCHIHPARANHRNRFMDWPVSEDGEYAVVKSFAISISFTLPNTNGTGPSRQWSEFFKASFWTTKNPSWKQSRLGRAVFVLSLIDLANGVTEKAGRDRIDLGCFGDTDEPKLWNQFLHNLKTKIEHEAVEIAKAHAGIFHCPPRSCKFSIDLNPLTISTASKDERSRCGWALWIHLDRDTGIGHCGHSMMNQCVGLKEEEQNLYLHRCRWCNTYFLSETSIYSHWGIGGRDSCRGQESEQRRIENAEPLPIPIGWCSVHEQAFNDKARFHDHLMLSLECAQTETKRRESLNLEPLLLNMLFFCQEGGCSSILGANLPLWYRSWDLLRGHYRTIHGMSPSKMPTRIQTTILPQRFRSFLKKETLLDWPTELDSLPAMDDRLRIYKSKRKVHNSKGNSEDSDQEGPENA